MEEFARCSGRIRAEANAVEIVRARVSGLVGPASGPATADALGLTSVAAAPAGETRQIAPPRDSGCSAPARGLCGPPKHCPPGYRRREALRRARLPAGARPAASGNRFSALAAVAAAAPVGSRLPRLELLRSGRSRQTANRRLRRQDAISILDIGSGATRRRRFRRKRAPKHPAETSRRTRQSGSGSRRRPKARIRARAGAARRSCRRPSLRRRRRRR